jgi:hypothetical protein
VREPSQFIVVRGDVFARVHQKRQPGQAPVCGKAVWCLGPVASLGR